jgi:hypothetical protein
VLVQIWTFHSSYPINLNGMEIPSFSLGFYTCLPRYSISNRYSYLYLNLSHNRE